MLDRLGEEDGCKLVRAAFSLELGVSFVKVPALNVEISEVEVERFGDNRTSADSPVRAAEISVFVVSFE